MKKYNDLIGISIVKIEEDENYIYFNTKENTVIRIEKFYPYCACNVGEYIDEISKDGICLGTITNIEIDIKGNQDCYYDDKNEIVYKGIATFYFENGKLDVKVHGEDNGYYGVSFTMPIEVIK